MPTGQQILMGQTISKQGTIMFQTMNESSEESQVGSNLPAESKDKLSCEECGAETPDLLPTSNGRLLCPTCSDKQEGSMGTVARSISDLADTIDEFAIDDRPTCDHCGEPQLSLNPVAMGLDLLPSTTKQLLCPTCILETEEELQTMGDSITLDVMKFPLSTVDLKCESCNQPSAELLPSPDGRILCATCRNNECKNSAD